jgi:V8-like Glu-specific endopeptidase
MKQKLRRLSDFASGLVFLAIVLSLAAFSVETQSVREVKVIYGPDDRQDVYEVTNPDLLSISQATVAIFDDYKITDNGDGTYDLNTTPYADYLNFCETEPFLNQPTVGSCSGFLVAPDIIATAGHCIAEDENCADYQARCEQLRFVFGFQMTDQSTAVTTLPEEDVYRCKPGDGLMDCVWTAGQADWALVRLDRPVVSRSPLPVRRCGAIAEQTSVGVVGHPAGLPQKIAVNAEVRSVETDFFVANLDTYGGNSGSPVFNTNDYVVEGILVRGEVDYVIKSQGCQGECYVSNSCPTTGCRGEDVTKSTEFSYLIEDFPPPPGESWTYSLVGTPFTFTTQTEAVSEQVGGYEVYRLRNTDNPPGLGEYYACSEEHGEVEVATDWWNVADPSDNGRYFYVPPLYWCLDGNPVGTVCNWGGTFGGTPYEVETVVLSYESVSVPFGLFENTMKVMITEYEDGVLFDEPFYFWFDEIGPVRAEGTLSGDVVELVSYSSPAATSYAGSSSHAIRRSLLTGVHSMREKLTCPEQYLH